VVRYSWRTQLKNAASPEAVVTLVCQFLDEWKPAELDELPREVRPQYPGSLRDVLHATVALAGAHASYGHRPGLKTLQELLLFYAAASVRGIQLENPQQGAQRLSPGRSTVANDEE
jgi:hypothetical protein